jgi:hypothetical protein
MYPGQSIAAGRVTGSGLVDCAFFRELEEVEVAHGNSGRRALLIRAAALIDQKSQVVEDVLAQRLRDQRILAQRSHVGFVAGK